MRGLFHSPYVCLLLIVGLRASVTPIMKFVLTTGQVDPVHGRRPALIVADVRLGEPLQGATLVGAAIILTGLEVLRRAHLSPSIRTDARSQQALSRRPAGCIGGGLSRTEAVRERRLLWLHMGQRLFRPMDRACRDGM
jgi:hypothetical protein